MYDCFDSALCVRTCTSACLHALWHGFERMCWEHADVSLKNFKHAGTLGCEGLHADRPPLMNNHLQQCKTKPLIAMRRWAVFQHDSLRSPPCSTFICVSQSSLGINNGTTFFYKGPVGCSLVAHCPAIVSVLQEQGRCLHVFSQEPAWLAPVTKHMWFFKVWTCINLWQNFTPLINQARQLDCWDFKPEFVQMRLEKLPFGSFSAVQSIPGLFQEFC